MILMLVKHFSKVISIFIKNFKQFYYLGGYYSIRYPSQKQNLRFIALNTVMFQPQYSDHFDPNEPIQQIEYVTFKNLKRLDTSLTSVIIYVVQKQSIE